MPGGVMLEIVDDSDAVIGILSREEIHTLGREALRKPRSGKRSRQSKKAPARLRRRGNPEIRPETARSVLLCPRKPRIQAYVLIESPRLQQFAHP